MKDTATCTARCPVCSFPASRDSRPAPVADRSARARGHPPSSTGRLLPGTRSQSHQFLHPGTATLLLQRQAVLCSRGLRTPLQNSQREILLPSHKFLQRDSAKPFVHVQSEPTGNTSWKPLLPITLPLAKGKRVQIQWVEQGKPMLSASPPLRRATHTSESANPLRGLLAACSCHVII